MQVLKRDFLPLDFVRDASPMGYEGSISVQARQITEETDWLLSLAENNISIKGVVGWLELCASNIDVQISKYSEKKILKGLRHVLQDEIDDDFMLREEFMNGISCLGSTKLLYEILIFPRHLENAIKLVEMFPDQLFVLDHCAKPNIRSGEISEWAGLVKKLSSYTNICCKVSGLVTEADWQDWKPDHIYPYLDVIWNSFGEDRVMIGSDWPVCQLAASYPQVVCLAEGYFERYGARVIEKLSGGNASLIYQL